MLGSNQVFKMLGLQRTLIDMMLTLMLLLTLLLALMMLMLSILMPRKVALMVFCRTSLEREMGGRASRLIFSSPQTLTLLPMSF